MVKVQESLVGKGFGESYDVISDDTIKELGYEEPVNFYDELDEDIHLMIDYMEEPESLNGSYNIPNLRVLHEIIGDIDGEVPFGFGRLVYNIVDIGIPDNKIAIVIYLEIDDRRSGEYTIHYNIEDYQLVIVPDGHYLNYLLQTEDERYLL